MFEWLEGAIDFTLFSLYIVAIGGGLFFGMEWVGRRIKRLLDASEFARREDGDEKRG